MSEIEPLCADPDGPDVAYVGDYSDFSTAKAYSTGDQEDIILEKPSAALQKVLLGEAAHERDSVTFDTLDYSWPLLAIRLRAAKNEGKLSVLDFGGSLGSTFFQCRSFLTKLPSPSWSIVELPKHVACGQKRFADDTLKFYPTIDACIAQRQPNVLLLSGVLPYLPDPWFFLKKAAAQDFEWIILDHTAFIPADRDRLTVEVVHPRIYPASYSAWLSSQEKFLNNLPAGWEIATEFDALDRQLLDGVELVFKGFALRRSR